MDTIQPAASSSSREPVTITVAPSRNGRTPGKAHKTTKDATRRSYISDALKTPFEKRKGREKSRQALKDIEKEMKGEKEAEAERKRTAIRERRERKVEKERLENMKARMSAKKLQRMRKRQGRSKKISG